MNRDGLETISTRRAGADNVIQLLNKAKSEILAKYLPEQDAKQLESYVNYRTPELQKLQEKYAILMCKFLEDVDIYTENFPRNLMDETMQIEDEMLDDNPHRANFGRSTADLVVRDLLFWNSVADLRLSSELHGRRYPDQFSPDEVLEEFKKTFLISLCTWLLKLGLDIPEKLQFFKKQAKEYLESEDDVEQEMEAVHNPNFEQQYKDIFVNKGLSAGADEQIAERGAGVEFDRMTELYSEIDQFDQTEVAKQLPALLAEFDEPEKLIELILQKPE